MLLRRLSLSALTIAVLSAFLASGCAGGESIRAEGPSSGDGAVAGSITVFAASSLSDAFNELGRKFEIAHPGSEVRFNFGGSSALALQINEGGPADVFASADGEQMARVVQEGNALAPQVFARNVPVVVVPAKGAKVGRFEDLGTPGVKLVLAAEEVPAGRYSRQILANASMPGAIAADFSDRALANLKSNEANVRAVLTKVQLGEADAGIVYATDVAAASGDVNVVEIPVAFNVTAAYEIASVTASGNRGLAASFVEYVLSAEGQATLQKYGFQAP